MSKSTIAILGVLVLFGLFIGSAVYYKNSAVGGGTIPTAEIGATDWKIGDGKVVVMEYSDFQCPACGAYFPVVEKVIGDNIKDLTFVYRNFPLPQHQNAMPAARAAEAAGKQGKFWEMYRQIFSTQSDWSKNGNAKDVFVGYAEKLGLDKNKFATDMSSSEVSAKIQNDYKSGVALEVQGTPSFFINGKKINNPSSFEAFQKIILDAIAESKGIQATTTAATTTKN